MGPTQPRISHSLVVQAAPTTRHGDNNTVTLWAHSLDSKHLKQCSGAALFFKLVLRAIVVGVVQYCGAAVRGCQSSALLSDAKSQPRLSPSQPQPAAI